MRIVAVDPSLRSSGIYIRTDDERHGFRICPKKCSADRALAEISFKMNKLLIRFYPFDLALIEAYPPGIKSHRNAIALQWVYGVIRSTIATFDIPIVSFYPSTWQSITGIRMPKGTKAKTKAYVEEVLIRYGAKFESTDVCDAYLIYRAARALIAGPGKTDAQNKLRDELLAALAVND